MEADVSIRPEARFKHMGETTFIQDNTYEVTDRRGNLLKLRRTTSLAPTGRAMQPLFDINGEEEIEVLLDSGMVRKRHYRGTFAQTDETGRKHSADVELLFEAADDDDLRGYWRSR